MLNICTTYKALRGLDGVKINRSLLHHALKNTENIDTAFPRQITPLLNVSYALPLFMSKALLNLYLKSSLPLF